MHLGHGVCTFDLPAQFRSLIVRHFVDSGLRPRLYQLMQCSPGSQSRYSIQQLAVLGVSSLHTGTASFARTQSIPPHHSHYSVWHVHDAREGSSQTSPGRRRRGYSSCMPSYSAEPARGAHTRKYLSCSEQLTRTGSRAHARYDCRCHPPASSGVQTGMRQSQKG